MEYVKPQRVVEAGKSHQFKTGRINVLNLAAQRGDADEVGRSLHQGCKPSLLGVSQPLLEGDRRLIGPGIEEQLLGPGWKCVANRACSEGCIATEPDGRGNHAQVAAAGYVGNDKFSPAAERGSFLLQLLLDALQVCRIQLRTAVSQFGDELVAVARQCNENEIGIQHRDQGGNNAGADLTHIIVLPAGRQCRERDQIADATPQLIETCRRLCPRHCLRLERLGGPVELDTFLLWFATPNWFSSSARGVRREEKAACVSYSDTSRHNLKASRRCCTDDQGCHAFRAR